VTKFFWVGILNFNLQYQWWKLNHIPIGWQFFWVMTKFFLNIAQKIWLSNFWSPNLVTKSNQIQPIFFQLLDRWTLSIRQLKFLGNSKNILSILKNNWLHDLVTKTFWSPRLLTRKLVYWNFSITLINGWHLDVSIHLNVSNRC